MNNIQIMSLFFNFLLYLFMIFPIFLLCFNKKFFNSSSSSSKKKFLFALLISFIIEIPLSILVYIFPENIFSIFTNTKGIINHAVYSSKILFIFSSFYGIKILVPAYLKNKKAAILIFSKIAATFLLSLILFIIFNIKGFLYAFPISDFIFIIIYILNIIR